jgi:hypothetical protein
MPTSYRLQQTFEATLSLENTWDGRQLIEDCEQN